MFQNGREWYRFCDPVDIVQTRQTQDVLSALDRVDQWISKGFYAAGFITYEAASGIDHALKTWPGSSLPLLWFGIYPQCEKMIRLPDSDGYQIGNWVASISPEMYRARIDRVRNYIAAGDTYQVNFTYRLRARFEGDALGFWQSLIRSQGARFSGFVDTTQWSICSASPELFFSLNGSRLICRPRKGTSPRGLTLEEDRQQKETLRLSEKNRAENAMIVDMVRNDLGRIASAGSVKVSSLFKVERYPTVLQMTSTVRSRSTASFCEIIRALFPCASITGAPKVRTMEIILEIEDEPRGIYTGCIGYLGPDRRGRFNVAIRTAVVDKKKKESEYGVGGGIVWDSHAAEEYEECRIKSAVLQTDWPEFELLETMLWDGEKYFLLQEHLQRLEGSAEYFDFRVNIEAVRRRLLESANAFGKERLRVRLRVDRFGKITIEEVPIFLSGGLVWRHVRFIREILFSTTRQRIEKFTIRPGPQGMENVTTWYCGTSGAR